MLMGGLLGGDTTLLAGAISLHPYSSTIEFPWKWVSGCSSCQLFKGLVWRDRLVRGWLNIMIQCTLLSYSNTVRAWQQKTPILRVLPLLGTGGISNSRVQANDMDTIYSAKRSLPLAAGLWSFISIHVLTNFTSTQLKSEKLYSITQFNICLCV